MDLPLVIVLMAAGVMILAFLRPGGAPELAAIGAMAALTATGILTLEDLAGVLGNSAPLAIAMMFVISAALERTGCLEAAGGLLRRVAGRSPLRALLAVMLTAAAASAMMNNTPVVIVMTPLAIALARSVDASPSRLLMPLSFAAIFGGMTTAIGTSTNLLVSGVAEQRGLPPLGMFEMTAPALILAAAGMLYMAFVGRFLLPERAPRPAGAVRRWRLPELRPLRAFRGGASAPRSLSAAAAAEIPAAGFGPAPAPRRRRKAPIAAGAVVLVALLAALGVAPLEWLAAGGAAAVVLTGCVRPGEAFRAIDWRILFLILGMLGLSVALRKTGAEAAAAGLLAAAGEGLPPVLTLLLIYALTSLLTELISNNAVALLAAPIALAVAERLGVDARPFLMAVMFAASASFATPIGYQTNTLVYGAGGYRFTDFLRVGVPLNLLFAALATVILPVFFPF